MSNQDPRPAVAVSPVDQSSDRTQSDADQVITVEKLDELVAATKELALATITATTREAVAKSRFRLSMIALLTATLVCLALLAVILWRVNQNLDAARRNGAQQLDCVTPGGKCYAASKASTGRTVATINQVSVLAAACAPDFVKLPVEKRIPAITACIVKGLK